MLIESFKIISLSFSDLVIKLELIVAKLDAIRGAIVDLRACLNSIGALSIVASEYALAAFS